MGRRGDAAFEKSIPDDGGDRENECTSRSACGARNTVQLARLSGDLDLGANHERCRKVHPDLLVPVRLLSAVAKSTPLPT